MDWLSDILTSNNGVALATLSIVVIIFAIIGAKHGLVNIKTKKCQIGTSASENERMIMKNQQEFVELAVEAFEKEIPKPDDYNVWRGKYILEKVLDEINRWIIYNHIQETNSYIEIHQEKVWVLVQSLTDNSVMSSKTFKKKVDENIERIIRRLVAIREEYEK